jgi:hypothetical protein
MASYRLAPLWAEVDASFFELLLTLNPLRDYGSAKPPQLSDANSANDSSARKFLESLQVNLHNSRSFLRVQ